MGNTMILIVTILTVNVICAAAIGVIAAVLCYILRKEERQKKLFDFIDRLSYKFRRKG